MTRELIGAALILLVLIIGLNIYWSVGRKRKQQEASLPEPFTQQSFEPLFDCFYVATVFANNPLERVWAYELGPRGKAVIGRFESELVIGRVGERSFAIPVQSIEHLGRGGATIDRGVEKSGLVQIGWKLGDARLLTSLRITSNQEKNFSKLKEVVGV